MTEDSARVFRSRTRRIQQGSSPNIELPATDFASFLKSRRQIELVLEFTQGLSALYRSAIVADWKECKVPAQAASLITHVYNDYISILPLKKSELESRKSIFQQIQANIAYFGDLPRSLG